MRRLEIRITFWLGSLKGRDHSEKPKHKWEDNLKMKLKETGYEDVDLIHPRQDRRW
jgi:hypothetical protein